YLPSGRASQSFTRSPRSPETSRQLKITSRFFSTRAWRPFSAMKFCWGTTASLPLLGWNNGMSCSTDKKRCQDLHRSVPPIVVQVSLPGPVSAMMIDRGRTDEFVNNGEAIAAAFAASNVNLILDGDAAPIQARIDQVKETPGVDYVFVVD